MAESSLSNDDILEILSRLPVKTLCRFKCVAKSWNKFISDLRLTANQPCILLIDCRSKKIMLEKNDGVMRIKLSWADMQGNVLSSLTKEEFPFVFWTSQLSGDLVCFSVCDGSIYVYNPFSQELAALPPSSCCDMGHIGFGYLPETGEYKVVKITIGRNSRFEIFTFDNSSMNFCSSSWRSLEIPCPSTLRGHGIVVGTIIYWEFYRGIILAFDIKNERHRSIYYSIDISLRAYLLNFGGKLCLIDRLDSSAAAAGRINIWRLEDETGSTWVKVHTIKNLFTSPLYLYPRFLYNGEILVTCYNGDKLELCFYNIEKGDFRKGNMPIFSEVLGIQESHFMLIRKK